MTDKYVDPWADFKSIEQKLNKPRFMRKPNRSEACREYLALAHRLQEDEKCPQYAALCHLQAARLEQLGGRTLAENAALKNAARLFMQVEQEGHHYGMPGLHEQLASAIHCYSHAIRTHLEMKQYLMAGCVCKQLAAHLVRLDRTDEACEHLQKAVRYLDSEPCSKVDALWRLAECQLDCDRPYEALATIDELWANLIKLDELRPSSSASSTTNSTTTTPTTSSTPPTDTWRTEMLRDAEIAIILVLLHMRCDPTTNKSQKMAESHNMSERHAAMYQQYAKIDGTDDPLPSATGDSYLSDADYLQMQSFVLAVKWREAEMADTAITQLIPGLKALHSMLYIDIVERLYTGDYDVDS